MVWCPSLTWLLIFFSLSLPSFALADAKAEEAYQRGYEAFRDGDFRSAMNAFKKAVSRMDAENADYVQVHYNLGRCVEGILERETDPALACRGAAWFQIYLERGKRDADLRTLDRARAGLASLEGICNSGTQTGAADNTAGLTAEPRTRVVPWGLTLLSVALLSGGAYALFRSTAFLNEREKSRLAFETSMGEERERHRVDVRRHELNASSHVASGWTLAGTGAAVGITAILAWLDVDAPRIHHAGGETGFSYAWEW